MTGAPASGARDVAIVVSAHLPSRTSREAGQRLVHEQIRLLAERFDVVLISCANDRERAHPDPTLAPLCAEMHVIPVSWASRVLGILARPWLPALVASRSGRRIRALIEKHTADPRAALVWVEYAQMLEHVPSHRASGVATVVVCHDLLTQAFERHRWRAPVWARPLAWAEWRRVRAWETRALRKASVAVTYSAKDAELASALGAERVRVLLPRVATPASTGARKLADAPTVVFFAALNRRENDEAARDFVAHSWPAIKRAVPRARLLLLGNGPSDALRRMAGEASDVTVTGFVEDPAPLLRESWIAVAPLLRGAGIKIKVLEYLAHGVPAVATPVGSEGVEAGSHDGLLVAAERAELVARCIELLGDPARCLALGERAAHWFATWYAPASISAERLHDVVRDAGRERPAAAGAAPLLPTVG